MCAIDGILNIALDAWSHDAHPTFGAYTLSRSIEISIGDMVPPVPGGSVVLSPIRVVTRHINERAVSTAAAVLTARSLMCLVTTLIGDSTTDPPGTGGTMSPIEISIDRESVYAPKVGCAS